MAKGIVVYFSQSGNTKKIAEAIHRGMSRLMEQCDIARLRDVDSKDLAKYNLIGLGSPIWVYREPANVGVFIESMIPDDVEGKHAFSFCTHGTCLGNYFAKVVPALMQKGLTVIGWNDWYCSVYLPYMPKPYYTDGHPDNIDLKEAEDFGREMVERSKKITTGETKLIPALPRGREYDELYFTFPGGVHRYFPKDMMEEFIKVRNFQFVINMDKCTRCGICEDNCPTNSIDFSESPPVFRPTCDRCWFCEQICPEGAIEVDWEPHRKLLSRLADITIAPPAEKAEAQGLFRRLVPKEDINWDTPWFKVKKHPRLSPML
jgi:NAD-dependent dihydropyrimidine dehydrogenase PreA subunit/flavodoxin